MMADFLWHNKGTRRVHWIAWNKLCMSKEEGGLGLRKLSLFNHATLTKQLWCIISNPDNTFSWILKHKYFPTSISSQREGARDAPTRGGICWKLMVCWKLDPIPRLVMGTVYMYVWRDRRIPRLLSFRLLTVPNTIEVDATVHRMITGAGEWNEDVNQILAIPLDRRHDPDVVRWHYEKHGHFTVRSAFSLAYTSSRSSSSSFGSQAFGRRTFLQKCVCSYGGRAGMLCLLR
ncbi:UNVERIFIED_CONTAM: putative mitochondrial protein [Sesamum latifolium]|uniref:Mitochondrial protein n=1 Tax=Sesamum latifolium TaxID=2727402 RepID=A0AAW2UIV5_9LAMI